MVAGHIATLFEQRISRIVMVGAGGLKATRKPGPKLRKLLPEMPPEILAAEARRNLEILMLHDPAKVDGVAIYMQIMNTTRAKTRSRDMGQAYKLSEVLPRVKTPLSGIWGEFEFDHLSAYPGAHRSVSSAPAGLRDERHPRGRPLGCLRGRRGVQ